MKKKKEDKSFAIVRLMVCPLCGETKEDFNGYYCPRDGCHLISICLRVEAKVVDEWGCFYEGDKYRAALDLFRLWED